MALHGAARPSSSCSTRANRSSVCTLISATKVCCVLRRWRHRLQFCLYGCRACCNRLIAHNTLGNQPENSSGEHQYQGYTLAGQTPERLSIWPCIKSLRQHSIDTSARMSHFNNHSRQMAAFTTTRRYIPPPGRSVAHHLLRHDIRHGLSGQTDSGLSMVEWDPIFGAVPLAGKTGKAFSPSIENLPRLPEKSTWAWISPVSNRSTGSSSVTAYSVAPSARYSPVPVLPLGQRADAKLIPKLAFRWPQVGWAGTW